MRGLKLLAVGLAITLGLALSQVEKVFGTGRDGLTCNSGVRVVGECRFVPPSGDDDDDDFITGR